MEEALTEVEHVTKDHVTIGGADVHNVVFNPRIHQLEYGQLGFKTEAIPPYQAVFVENEEISDQGSVGLIYLAGATGTAPAYGGVVAELSHKDQQSGINFKLSAVIGSSASVDTADTKFSRSIKERGTHIACFIYELIKEHPTERLIILGQSLGGMELPYVVGPLKKLLKENNVNTNIEGLIFFQSGGIYEQSLLRVSSKIPEFMSLKQGIRELWPSPYDVFEAYQKAEEARAKSDMSECLHWERRATELKEKGKETPYLTANEKDSLQWIDYQLKNVNKKTERVYFEIRRYLLLSGIIQKISTTDNRTAKLREIATAFINTARATVLNQRLNDVARPLPKEVREGIDIPVAFVWGDTDQFFPRGPAQMSLALQSLSAKRSYFPNSPAMFNAQMLTGPHELANTDTSKFSRIVHNITRRVLNFNDTRTESSEKPQKQEVIDLYYQ